MPLKERKWLHWWPWHLKLSCTSAQRGWRSSSSIPICSLLPIRCWAQMGTDLGPPSLRHCGAGPLHGARLDGPGPMSRQDAVVLLATGMLTPLHADPLLPTLSRPAGHRQHRKSVRKEGHSPAGHQGGGGSRQDTHG